VEYKLSSSSCARVCLALGRGIAFSTAALDGTDKAAGDFESKVEDFLSLEGGGVSLSESEITMTSLMW